MTPTPQDLGTTDLPPASEDALALAIALAQQMNARSAAEQVVSYADRPVVTVPVSKQA